MQKTSSLYERLKTNPDRSFDYKVEIDGAGVFSSNRIKDIKTNIKMFQEDPEIGKAKSAEIDAVLLVADQTIPQMACIRPYVKAYGIAPKSSTATVVNECLVPQSASYSNENATINTEVSVSGENIIFQTDGEEYLESEWLPQGVFFIDTREITANQNDLNALIVHGFDAMLKTEQSYESNDAAGDNYDTAYVRAIASAIGVEVDDRTWAIMGTGYIIPFPLGYSMREILGYIAASYAGSFVITDEGKLRLVSLPDIPAETNLLIDQIGDVILIGGDSILV